MPLNEEFDRYFARTQQRQTISLHDPEETILSKLPVEGGEVILTRTRLYLAVGDDGQEAPNLRLERSAPRSYPEEQYLEVAPRMGVFLAPGQTGEPFLQVVEEARKVVLDRIASETRRTREGIRRRHDHLLARADDRTLETHRRKSILRDLHTASPDRPEAATRLADLYLGEGNHRAAALWLIRAGVFDERFDRCLDRLLHPRLPSREVPPPERWIQHRLAPLLGLPAGEGPSAEQRGRITEALERIEAFREAYGRASVPAILAFLVAVAGWGFLLFRAPWVTLGSTTLAAFAVGGGAALRARGQRPPKR
ncbi:MAG: hypothetical protein PVF68_07765 [Acidobacteriota bacterium]|jgi:hypothetical protein